MKNRSVKKLDSCTNANCRPAAHNPIHRFRDWGWMSVAGLFLLIQFAGCATYRFGNQSLFPAHIKTVHIAMFENDTFQPGLGEWLTEGVIKEIQDRTPFQLASPSNADSFLKGRLVRTQKNFAIENAFDEGRDIAYLNQVEITWTDRTGMPLTTSQRITLTEDANFIPESGQSLTTAQLELIQRLSRQIVNQMETPW